MTERVQIELGMIRAWYPSLEFLEAGMAGRIPGYLVPSGWGNETIELVFQIPPNFPGQEPYGIWIRPALDLPGGGAPTNSTGPVSTAFGDDWQQFSWAPDGWAPGVTPQAGSNMLGFIHSFTHRLQEIN